jgi:DNA-binding NarL/FixJ family response regulator
MPSFRILIADDHEIVRQGLRSLLETHPGWEVCGEAVDGWETVRKAEHLQPDLVTIDIGMPNLNGLDAARQILSHNSNLRILFLTLYETEQAVRTAIQIGAQGLVLKSDAARELVAAVEAIQRNSTYFSPRIGAAATGEYLRGERRPAERGALTRRERQVVQLLAEGKSTKEVAALLNVSVKTAETHRSHVMTKLKLHSAGELVLYAVRNNIVQALSCASPSPNATSTNGDNKTMPPSESR